MLGIEIKYEHKIRHQSPSYRTVFSFSNSGDIIRMLLQYIWQTVQSNSRVGHIIVRIHFRTYNRIHFGKIHVEGELSVFVTHAPCSQHWAFNSYMSFIPKLHVSILGLCLLFSFL
jgi:hypothetical protein